jgi:hypothetical protein
MAAVSRIRDPQRLVELVAETMVRESTRAERVRRLNGSGRDRLTGEPTEAATDRKVR